jgi:hypothetical protein
MFGRDYLIIPTEFLLGIAGCQKGAPAWLRLRAEGALKVVIGNLRANNGAYRPAPSVRIATIDQAWLALMLKAASGAMSAKPARWSGLTYQLRRERRDNWFSRYVFPFISISLITILGVISKDSGVIVNVATSIGTLVIGGLYGSNFVRRLFPGRE